MRASRAARACVLGIAFANASAVPAAASTASGTHGAVATDQALASDVGLGILERGGNAVDAAVAIGYALAVTYPGAGNLGGGGFMIVHRADGTTHFIDFRETAPSAATRSMYDDPSGRAIPERSTIGALAVAVPGTVAGLELARAKYGSLPRHELVEPAISLAEGGFTLRASDAAVFSRSLPLLTRFPSTAAVYTHGGAAFAAGVRVRFPALARTLRAIDRGGADAFYRGDIAQRIALADRAAGGVLSAADFAAYRAVEREPVACPHGTSRIETAPPPSSGGVVLCETLGIMDAEPSHARFRSAADAHLEIEAERRAFADRSSALGDPDFTTPPIARLLSPAYLIRRRDSIVADRATPSSEVVGLPLGEGSNTTNYSVIDAKGNAVDVTYTLNSTFGSGLVAGDTGVLLNDEMDDFATEPGAPNQFGLVQGSADDVGPNKRPLSSMSPTIVLDDRGRVVLVAGAAGGPRIITTTLDLVRRIVDDGEDGGFAIDAPRLHEQWLPDVVDVEPATFDAATTASLTKMGYTFATSPAGSIANAIVVRADGTRVAAHDDRAPTGSAVAY